ncbi:MAG: zinc-dependent metalloprotease, partial [Planctomycetota bacterium]
QGDTAEVDEYRKFVGKMSKTDGYFPFYWDQKTGKIYLEIERLDEEFLFVHSLATGLGSNPVGLDRGQLGDQKVVHFHRVGPKILLVQKNLRFRAQTENLLEKRAVEQSFAQSIIWGGEIEVETEGKLLTDITDLLLSDIHGVIRTLSRSDQGSFSLDEKRSAIFLPRCKGFPENTELEATLTFAGKKPGRYVNQTTPTANSVTLRQHHSFVKLPDDKYQPRVYDVRCPCLSITFADYASPVDSNLERRYILRHRLIKKADGNSDPIEPIVYYVDAGAPTLIQKALVEGASWWNQAFESAGFTNAFQVKILPADVDPLDVRYNVIQWVHRSTRGWSYGGSVIDPRTGEIIKGHVTLGSLRVRQDQLLFNSLEQSKPFNCACCGIGGIPEESTLASLTSNQTALETALARIRQLSAHEVGHTLGFVHNFAASTYDDRASVMDYPAPRIKIDDQGNLDFSDAYAVGIGSWDKVSVKYAYQEFAAEDETQSLQKILTDATEKGMWFISDADARPQGAAHPLANLWDNGSDPIEEFKHVLRVRKIALERFDPTRLPPDVTSADIAQYLTPIYLHHRYQAAAVGKMIGGYVYGYGYSQSASQVIPVSSERQNQAFQVLLESIHPASLELNPRTIESIAPRPYTTIRDPEILPTWSGRIFDPLAASKVAIDMTLDQILNSQRLNRVYQLSRIDKSFMTPSKLIFNLIQNQWIQTENSKTHMAIRSLAKESVVDRLINLIDDKSASFGVRSAAHAGLKTILIEEAQASTEPQWQSTLYRKI